jgi:hypothetical protein
MDALLGQWPSNAVTTEVVTTNSFPRERLELFLIVRSNDFSRCLRVMAFAITRTIRGGGVDGCVTWHKAFVTR